MKQGPEHQGSAVTAKEKIVRTIEGLPAGATIEDAMERLFFLAKVERGLKQADEGQTVSAWF